MPRYGVEAIICLDGKNAQDAFDALMAALDADLGFTIHNEGPNRQIRVYPVEETTASDLTEVDEALDPFWDEDEDIDEVPS